MASDRPQVFTWILATSDDEREDDENGDAEHTPLLPHDVMTALVAVIRGLWVAPASEWIARHARQ